MGELDEILKEFLVETQENLDQLDQDFVALEENPKDKDRIASIFRAVHTVKGTCGFLGFAKLEKVAHVAENLLCKLRDEVLNLTPDITDALLASIDAIREILATIESTGNDGENSYPELVEQLTALLSGKTIPTTPKKDTPAKEASSTKNDTPKEVKPEETTPKKDTHQTLSQVAAKNQTATKPSGPSIAESTIRVDVDLLDHLMNLVGELVLARNQVVQVGSQIHIEDAGFSSSLQQLNLITSDLQERVMKTRMQPIGNAWSKFPRLVRDLANSCNKQVCLRMEGKETELDKSLLEAIRDPLTHMVRNAVDHGIETSAKRSATGKPEEGTLILRSYHESGQVIIEIVDDGGGIDKSKLVKKALEKKLIDSTEAENMSDREIMNLLFMPGFSTAEKVTNVSGRGVGMDVVRNNIEKVGGNVEIQSELGKGSTFRVRIPLTLAIVPALIVTCAGERYAIPQMSLIELVRLNSNNSRQSIEMIGGAPVYRLRGKLLPLVYLSQVLAKNSESSDSAESDSAEKGFIDSSINIVVLHTNERQFGVVVDTIQNNQEIVVKPLGHILRNQSLYAGATILGDGRVALILDVTDLGEHCGLDTRTQRQLTKEDGINDNLAEQEKHRLLVCGIGDNNLTALPLSQVTRLEKLPIKNLEHAGDRCLIQYRNNIMQLIDVEKTITQHGQGVIERAKTDDSIQLLDVVVYTVRGKSVGLVVSRIEDVIEVDLSVQGKANRQGVMCTIALRDRVVEVLDINKVIRLADPSFFK